MKDIMTHAGMEGGDIFFTELWTSDPAIVTGGMNGILMEVSAATTAFSTKSKSLQSHRAPVHSFREWIPLSFSRKDGFMGNTQKLILFFKLRM